MICLIKLPTVKTTINLSKSSIYELMKQDSFSKSIRIGKRGVEWVESEVQQWIKDKIYQSRNV